MSLPDGVERRKVWLIGLDQVTISGVANIRKALDCGDIERPITETRKLADLPFWARWFFPVTRFHSERFGWFLPLISDTVASYCPRRAFLDAKFASRAFLDEDVTAAADLLGREEAASDDELIHVFVQAVQRSLTPTKPIPKRILQAANSQISTPTESFLPWKRLPSAWGTSTVYEYASESRKDIPGASTLPDGAVVEIAHASSQSTLSTRSMQVVMALQRNGPVLLRAAAANPDMDTGVLFARTSPDATSQVVRQVSMPSTLDGLLPAGDPAVPGKTFIIIRTASAALETDDELWALGSGTEERACAARPVLLDFVRAVQQELVRRRDST